jgi:prepilin-type N-terminal cleavage/methylation domain-containing protein
MKTKYNQLALVSLTKKVLSNQNPKTSNQSGFSLVESLVAVVVVGVLLTGIAPFLALTFGQRVQARRIDQATQAARQYIEGVRGGTIPIPTQFNNANFNTSNLGVPVLTALPTDSGTQISTDGLPFNPSNPQHLVIQPIRSTCVAPLVVASCNSSAANLDAVKLQGYRLSVRVYRADAFSTTPIVVQAPVAADGSSTVQSAFSATLGSRSRPLVVMQSEITTTSVGNSLGTTFTDYQNRLGN